MPPNTAIRVASGVAPGGRSVGTNGSKLITGVASLMAQRIRPQRLRHRLAQARVGRLDEDRADENAAVGDHATVLTEQAAGVVILHHFRGDALFGAIAALPPRLSADAQRREDLEARPGVA